MEIKSTLEKVFALVKKYKYVILILLIGLVLLMLPDGETKHTKTTETTKQDIPETSFEEKLKSILMQIHGAGRVEVMLTVAEGEEIIYQTDDDFSNSADTNNNQIDTVIITDSNRNQAGLIRKTNPPVYQGAIIVCQGADNPTVKLAITEAVSKITGIGANCISVLKMK